MNTTLVLSFLLVITAPFVLSKKWQKPNKTCKRCSWFKPACTKQSDDFIKDNCYEGLFKTVEQLHKDLDHIRYKCKRGLEARDILVYGETDCPYCPVVKKYGEASKVFNTGNGRPINQLPTGGFGNHPCCVTIDAYLDVPNIYMAGDVNEAEDAYSSGTPGSVCATLLMRKEDWFDPFMYIKVIPNVSPKDRHAAARLDRKYSYVSPTKLVDPDTGDMYTVATYNRMRQWIWFGRCEVNGAACYNNGQCYEQWDFPTEILVENPGGNPPFVFKEYHYPRQCLCSQ